jgi:O-antigen/teichoic acid export membrane protein
MASKIPAMKESGAGGSLRSMRALQRLWDPGAGLATRTANAGLWAFTLSITARLLNLVRTLVLARVLAPDDFGLMTIAVIALTMLETFTRTGFEPALIQRKGDIAGHLDSAWTISVMRGVVLGVALFFGAPVVGRFFSTSEATPLVQALALVSVLGGLRNVGVVYFDKELQFRERFLYRSLPVVVDLIVSVGIALAFRSVWALVIGRIAGQAAMTVASFVAHDYRPRFRLEADKVRDLFGFGMWITASSIIVYFVENLDYIAIGRLLSSSDLGLYQMAFTISALLWYEITLVVDQVVFPALSKLQADTDKLREGYLGTLEVVSLLALPATAGLWFIGPTAVPVVLGENWTGLLPAYGALLIRGLLRSIGGTTAPLFRSMGKPRISTMFLLATLGLMAALLFPFTSAWGIAGAAWATVIGSVPVLSSIWVAGRMLHIERRRLIRPLAFPAAAALLMLGTLSGAKLVLPGGAWLLLWAPLLGLAIFIGLLLGARRLWDYRPGHVLLSRLDREVRREAAETAAEVSSPEDV